VLPKQPFGTSSARGGSKVVSKSMLANGKHRKTRIFQLQEENRIIEGDEALKNILHPTMKAFLEAQLKIISDWLIP
jgi:hypothetical protein